MTDLRERIREAVSEANVPDANEYDPVLVNDDVTNAVMEVLSSGGRSLVEEALRIPPHPFVSQQASSTHCLLFVMGGTCRRPPDDPLHGEQEG